MTDYVEVYGIPPITAKPDLVSRNLSNDPSNPVEGSSMSFSGVVRNRGDASAGRGSWTRLRLDVNNDGTWNWLPDNRWTGNLAAGAAETETWSGWTAVVGTHKFEICADVTDRVDESNEGNNCTTKTFTVTAPPPTCTLTANPSSGTAPLSGTLIWTTTNNPTSCEASSGAWSGSKSTTGGSEGYGPLNNAGTYTYSLSCTNAGGTGTCSATVDVSALPSGSIVGRIWIDQNNVGGACNEVKGPSYDDGLEVSYSPCASPSCSTMSDSSGDYRFDAVPVGGYQVSITLPGPDWRITNTQYPCPASVEEGEPPATANFGISNNPLSWIQGISGDIYGNGISVEVPSRASCDDSDVCDGYNRWFLDAYPGHAATYPGGGVVISGDPDPSNLTCGGGGTPGRCSRRPSGNPTEPGWHVTGEEMGWPSLPTLTPVGSPDWDNLEPREVYFRSPPLSPPDHYNLTGPGVAVIYIQGGNLRFETNLISDAPNSEGVIFIVESGQAIIRPNVSRIDALILVVDGTIRVEGDGVDNPLNVRGMLYAEGGFSFNRTLTDNTKPAVMVEYNPLYLYYPNPLVKPQILWREVAP